MEYDYASCSDDELLDVQRRINREKFPETYALLVAEIERREPLPVGERDGELNSSAGARQPLFSENTKRKITSYVLLLFALFLFFNGFAEPVWFTTKSANWPTVPCTIFYDRDSNKAGEIRYQYVVDGQTYVGKRLSSSGTLRKQRSWKREYSEGQAASCRVNPNHPRESTLTWGPSATVLLDLLFSCLLFSAALQSLKAKSNKQKSRQL